MRCLGAWVNRMSSQPRAMDVREGHEQSEGKDFRSGLLLLDRDGRIVSATEGLLRFFSMGFVLNLPAPLEILPGGLVELIRNARRTGQSVHAFPILWNRDGASSRPIPLEVDFLPIPGGLNQSTAVSLAVALRRSPQFEPTNPGHPGILVMERPELLSEVGHEIKNSLVAIKTFVELLLEQQPQLELARVVRDGVERISGSVARLLNASNPRLEFQSVGMHELIVPLLQIVRSQAGKRAIRFRVECDARQDVLRAQPRQLEQAILNIMMNGLEAMGEEGELMLRTENREVVLEAGSSPSPCLVVSMSDTGCGIPPQNLPRLFDEFFTTKKAGTGLGLPITRRIVMAHGGSMEVESQPGQGTTFRLIFPVA